MMEPNETAFLVLCEELNFTRAAQRCNMTQQGLSSHIRKMEEQYHTRFFLRVPSVQLTEAGHAMRTALLKKGKIEKDLLQEIQDINDGTAGKVCFGINSSRAAYLAPVLMARYCAEFEKVEAHFVTGDTKRLIRDLKEGRIDGLLGINAMPAPDLTVEPLLQEEVFLVLKKDSLYMNKGAKKQNAEENGIGEVSILELAAPDGPVFVRNEEGSTLNVIIDRMLVEHNARLRTHAYISDYNVQLSLCKVLGFAMFCPGTLVFTDGGPADDPELKVLRIREMKERMAISLVTDADRNYPACVTAFFRTVKSIFKTGI